LGANQEGDIYRRHKCSHENRKRLSINKSTLWYIQKHIKEIKKIKIYDKVRTKVEV
jgi:hypothetical protein